MSLRRLLPLLFLITLMPVTTQAQDYNSVDADGNVRLANKNSGKEGSNKKEAPRGMKVWTVDRTFGDIHPAVPDTLPYMFMNTIFTTGLRGEYNTTGNLGAPRINRIFTDRNDAGDFIFTHPYDYFITPPEEFHFTNTYSPITNISFNTCGNRTNGEDRFKAFFATNAGKRLGFGAKFDYIYGRGYYSDNSTSHINFALYGSYLGERYQAHLLFSNNHQKVAENGGITNDNYISHPEIFRDNYTENEIPTMLTSNWNRNDNQHVLFTHRYSFGFYRKVPMTEEEIKARKFAMESAKENAANQAKEKERKKAQESGVEFDEEEYDRQQRYAAENMPQEEPQDTTWLKDEYVPVTSFIHTADFNNYKRIYQSYYTPDNYYARTFPTVSRYEGDTIYDTTKHYELRNTFAVALLEGFNKYAKAGLKVFAAHDLKHFVLPDTTNTERNYNEHDFIVGGQISKFEGNTVHYDVKGEFTVAGENIGDIMVDGAADLNFPLLGDTVQLAASGFFHLADPTFYYTHFHSKHFWWDNDNVDKTIHTRIQGLFTLKRTKTHLRVAIDNLEKYAYFATSHNIVPDNNDNFLRLNNTAMVRQSSTNISLLTASLAQDVRLGPLNLSAVLTYQQSSQEDIIPVPAFNAYANLFMRFKIAHVLDCDMGADLRYFTKYYAPDYVPGIGQYAVQENNDSRVKIGNYPMVNVYANFFLKHARFFVMLSHVNYSNGGEYFLTPHYPLNQRILRFGISWNFFN